MKRLLALLMAFTLTAGLLTGCGDSAAVSGTGASPENAQTAEASESEPEEESGFALDPLTGEENDHKDSRPVAIMLHNEYEALPQWGVSEAEVMIEALTMGETTSLMCVFPHTTELPKVGPVAQAEDLFLQFMLPLNCIPIHIGATVYASNLLNLLEYQDLNGLYVGTTAFDLDKDRYNSGANNEFCWYTQENLVKNGLDYYDEDRHGDLVSLFSFAQEDREAVNDNGKSVLIRYSDSCEVGLHYNENHDAYFRDNGNGETMVDASNGEAVCFENVFVLYASSGCKDNYYMRDYDLTEGTGIYLAHGGYQEIVWQKGSATAPLKLYDLDGSELQVSPGTSYIGIYGGVDGQSVRVYDFDGEERSTPDDPEPMESYATYQEAVDTVQQMTDAVNQTAAEREAAIQAAAEENTDGTQSGEQPPQESVAPAEDPQPQGVPEIG